MHNAMSINFTQFSRVYCYVNKLYAVQPCALLCQYISRCSAMPRIMTAKYAFHMNTALNGGMHEDLILYLILLQWLLLVFNKRYPLLVLKASLETHRFLLCCYEFVR